MPGGQRRRYRAQPGFEASSDVGTDGDGLAGQEGHKLLAHPASLGGLLQEEKSSAESAMPDLGGLMASVLGGGVGNSGAGGLLTMLKNLFGGK